MCHYYTYFLGNCAILAIVVIRKQHSWVGLLVCFLSLELVRHPSCIRKASPQGGSVRRRCSLGLLGSVSKVHNVFSNRNLPSTSDGQSKAIVIAYNILGVSWAPLTNNSLITKFIISCHLLVQGWLLGFLELKGSSLGCFFENSDFFLIWALFTTTLSQGCLCGTRRSC